MLSSHLLWRGGTENTARPLLRGHTHGTTASDPTQQQEQEQNSPRFPLPSSSSLSSCLSSPFSPASNTGAGAAPDTNTSKAQVPTPRATSSHADATPRPSLHEGTPQALPSDITSQAFPTRKEKKDQLRRTQRRATSERKTDHNPHQGITGGKDTWPGRETSAAEKRHHSSPRRTHGNPNTPPRHSCPQGLCPSAFASPTQPLQPTSPQHTTSKAPPPPSPRTATPTTHFPETTTATSQN